MWDSVDDAHKRREIRYGNNIAVLFRALLHCKKFYGSDNLWSAISRGFNTSHTIARVTADILADARRAQRSKPARDVSETARAADEWIDFVDNQGPHLRVLSDPEVYKVADDFFKTQEKTLLNAARVPVNMRHPLNSRREGDEDANSSPRLPPTPLLKFEDRDVADRNPLMRATRKRSTSPPPSDRSPKTRRFNHDVQVAPQTESGIPRQQDQAHRIPPSSPRRPSHPQATPRAPPPTSLTWSKGDSTPSGQTFLEQQSSALKARIAKLEGQLAAAESKLGSPVATGPPVKLEEDIGGLKKDMATVTNVIGSMMDSMHAIADNLNLLQNDISGLSTQQKELTAAIPSQTSNIDALLQPVQTIADNVNILTKEVSELKKQTLEQQAGHAAAAPESNSKLEGLVQEQTSRIDRLAREMASMQAHMTSSLPRQTPQSLRQAMAAAERDLAHHLTTVEEFYHQLGTRGGSRAAIEQTADFLATLQQSVQSAQMGQQGY